MGFRYRLRVNIVPGKPDLVFTRKKKAIFVHGCFWHLHDCGRYRLPQTRKAFWLPKLQTNVVRDGRVRYKLQESGWQSLVIWECEIKDIDRLKERIREFLDGR
jgi:DNA mismatch endonuclease (patch repair protein)